MKYYKAFEKGMVCRGKKYEVGKEYEEKGGKICAEGMMHFCETPFDTLDYYPLIDTNGEFSEFAEVEPLDEVEKDGNKCASRKIRVGAKLSFREFIKAGVDILIEKTNGNRAKIGSSSRVRIGSSGDEARIGSFGRMAQIASSGDWAKIGSSGCGAQIGSSGDRAIIVSSGSWAKIGSSGYGDKIGSSGHNTKIGNSGCGAQIGSSGDETLIGSSGDGVIIKMTGSRSVAAAVGTECAISGKKGDWIVLAEWKINEEGAYYPACVKAGKIDGEALKEDTMYMLIDGEFVAQD